MSSEAPFISRGISPLLPICVFNFSVTKKSFVQLIAGETLRRTSSKLGVFVTHTVAFHSPICHFFRVRNSFIAYCLRTLKIYINSTSKKDPLRWKRRYVFSLKVSFWAFIVPLHRDLNFSNYALLREFCVRATILSIWIIYICKARQSSSEPSRLPTTL